MQTGMILAPLLLVFIFALIACRPRTDPAKQSAVKPCDSEAPIPMDELAKRLAQKSEPYN
ncbi:MAG TPA: hypothetical protein VLB83_04075 [Candidatus Paceibacterota bacterium]|nr:hypothetical protein [Candidatus Paceibacterota bacterium]